MRPELRHLPVEGPVIDRHHHHGDDVRDEQDRGHGHGLVVEEFTREAVEEHQRDEHRAGGEHGAEHGAPHLAGALHHRAAQGFAFLPARGDIVRQDYGIVHHHTHSQQQSRERYDVDRQADEVEDEHRYDQRHRDGHGDQQRRAEVLHEQEDDHAHQRHGQDDVQQEVAYGVVQQLGLVAGHREGHLRVVLLELSELLIDAFPELGHARLALLDDGQHDGLRAVRAGQSRAGRLVLQHFRDVLYLQLPLSGREPDVSDVLARGRERAELDVVMILPVAYGEVREHDVGGVDAVLELAHADAEPCQGLLVGHDEDLAVRSAADVHHRHFRELLDALGDDVLGELAHLQEVPAAVLEGHVDVEGRDVRRAGLEHLRALDAGQRSHRAVNLLVDLDVEIVDVPAFLEGQGHRRAAVHGLGADVLQVAYLHEALPQWFDHGVVHLARGHVRGGDLDRHVRDVHIGDERHGQPPDADDAQYDEHQQHHRHGDASVKEPVKHNGYSPLMTTLEPSARLRLPETMMRSPSCSSAPRSALAWMAKLSLLAFSVLT